MFLKIILFTFLATLQIPSSQRAEQAIKANQAILKNAFVQQGLHWGSAVYIRIF